MTAPSLPVARWRALGTGVFLAATRGKSLPAARAAVEAEIEAVDRAASRFRSDSEVHALAGTGRPTPVTAVLAGYVRAALEAAAETDGAVDPTVGAALNDLGYDRTFDLVPPVGPGATVTVRTVPTWRSVVLDESAGTIQVPRGCVLDLGATAKARASDLAAQAAAEVGECGVLVNLGGDIAVAGETPGPGWPVLITDDSATQADRTGQVVDVRTGGLATSSITVRTWRRGGVRMHHLIDPWSATPARTPWRTVSVAAGSCLAANVAATAMLVRGEKGMAWLAARGHAARLVAHDGAITVLGGWPA